MEKAHGLNVRRASICEPLHLSWLGISYARSANRTHRTEKQDSKRDARVPTGQEFLELRCPLGRHPVSPREGAAA